MSYEIAGRISRIDKKYIYAIDELNNEKREYKILKDNFAHYMQVSEMQHMYLDKLETGTNLWKISPIYLDAFQFHNLIIKSKEPIRGFIPDTEGYEDTDYLPFYKNYEGRMYFVKIFKDAKTESMPTDTNIEIIKYKELWADCRTYMDKPVFECIQVLEYRVGKKCFTTTIKEDRVEIKVMKDKNPVLKSDYRPIRLNPNQKLEPIEYNIGIGYEEAVRTDLPQIIYITEDNKVLKGWNYYKYCQEEGQDVWAFVMKGNILDIYFRLYRSEKGLTDSEKLAIISKIQNT